MVRITVDDHAPTLHLKLEGKLAGVWVTELEECWKAYLERSPHKKVVVDLTNTEFVDLAGKYLLRLMYQSGVRFTARTPYMKALVAEVAGMDCGVSPADLRPEGAKS